MDLRAGAAVHARFGGVVRVRWDDVSRERDVPGEAGEAQGEVLKRRVTRRSTSVRF
jgi:hypothetical protein